MGDMFYNAEKFNQDISNWDVSGVIWFQRMFKYADEFNRDLSNWNIGSVTEIYEMFAYARSFNQTLCWDIPDSVETTDMFLETSSSLGCPPTGNPTEFLTNPPSSGPSDSPPTGNPQEFPTNPPSSGPSDSPPTGNPTEFLTNPPSSGPSDNTTQFSSSTSGSSLVPYKEEWFWFAISCIFTIFATIIFMCCKYRFNTKIQ